MFLDKSSTKDPVTSTAGTLAARARTAGTTAAAAAAQSAAVAAQSAASAAQNASAAAQHAAHDMGGRAQLAAAGLGKEVRRGVRQGVFTARSWAAPQLENAADYCTATVAPKVSDALRACARQVSPQRKGAKRSAALTWTLLGTAVLAALGAAGAVVRYRSRAAAAAGGEAEAGTPAGTAAGTAAGEDAGETPVSPDQPAPDSSADGRVSANGW